MRGLQRTLPRNLRPRRRLRFTDVLLPQKENELQPVAYLGPLLLTSLGWASTPVPEGEMLDLPLSSAAATQAVRELLPGALDQLTQDGLAERSEKGVSLSGKGKAQARNSWNVGPSKKSRHMGNSSPNSKGNSAA